MSPPQKIIIRHKKSDGSPLRDFGYLFAATDNRRLLFLKECDKTLALCKSVFNLSFSIDLAPYISTLFIFYARLKPIFTP